MQEAWKAYKDKIWLAGTGSILLVVLVANIFYVHKLKKNRKSFDKFREGKTAGICNGKCAGAMLVRGV